MRLQLWMVHPYEVRPDASTKAMFYLDTFSENAVRQMNNVTMFKLPREIRSCIEVLEFPP